jgi:hypothetical protein
MKHLFLPVGLAGLVLGCLPLSVRNADAQELEPRAYSVSPVGVNIVGVAYTFKGGDIAFDPSGPIDDASAAIHQGGLGYVRALGILGRSANIGVALPVVAGHVEGLYIGEFAEVDRFGLADLRLRLAVNLVGAPAMNLREFAGYRQRTNLGASIVVIAPTGEYDPTKLINLGTNRWSFKPEVAISQQIDRFTIEFYAGAWFFTDNTDFFGGLTREQERIASTQFHVLYTFRPRAWIGFNANFYRGGTTTVEGQVNRDLQENSRVGVTLALPLARRQSLRLSYSRGAFTTIGADFHAVGVSLQHLWGAGL